jgi:poly [ADP-ribose] polymerase
MKMDAADNYNIPGKPEHVNLSIKPEFLAPAGKKRTAKEALVSSAGTTGSSSVCSPSTMSTAKEEMVQTSKRRKITDKQKKVDPESGIHGHIYVDEAKGVAYSCTMNMVGEGFSKYYVLQLIRNTRGPHTYFTLFRKWGKTGQSWSRDSMHEDYTNVADAIAEFVKQFEQKTRNKFENVLHGFVKKANGYNLVDQYEDEDDNNLKQVLEAARALAKQQPAAPPGGKHGRSGDSKEDVTLISAAKTTLSTSSTRRAKPTKLTKAVKELVATIFDAKEIAKTMAKVGLNANKMPLGELSKTSIKEGYLTLSKIADLLTALSDNGDKQAAAIQLKAAVQKFYTIIPCASAFQTPIDASTLPVKIQFLDELMNIEACKEMVEGSGQSVEEQYLKLGVQLVVSNPPLPPFPTKLCILHFHDWASPCVPII